MFPEIIKALTSHLAKHPAEYTIALVIVFGMGWQGSSIAQQWMASEVSKIVIAQAKPIQEDVNALRREVQNVSAGVTELKIQGLSRELTEIKTLLCLSPGDNRLLRNYDDKMIEYERLVGRRYEPQPCDILTKRR